MNSGMRSPGAAAASCKIESRQGRSHIHDRDQLLDTSAIFHAAAGRGCARDAHAAAQYVPRSNIFNNTSSEITNLT